VSGEEEEEEEESERTGSRLRNLCHCGTHHRIREAIVAGAKKY
jgi:isoquinoline 1-oxidoreductase subunit alpha